MSDSGHVTAEVLKQAAIGERYLSFHAAIPLAREHIGVMLILPATYPEPVRSFVDLGCGDELLAPTETQCDWLREIGFEQVDCYFRIYELAVFAGRPPVHEL